MRPIFPLVLGLVLSLSAPAWGQSAADEAQILFDEAKSAYEQDDYTRSLMLFMQSNRLAPNPSVSLNIGHTYAAMGRYPEAYRWYAQSLKEGADNATVERLLEELEPNVVLLRVETTPEGSDVYLNRVNLGSVGKTPVTLAVDPAEYTIIVTAEGHETQTTEAKPYLDRGTPYRITGALKPETGMLVVTGLAGAEVHAGSADGVVVCTVPCETAQPIGSRAYYFTKEGYRAQPALAEILDKATTTLDVELILVTGAVRVDADEKDASIEIDGVPRGYTPAVISGVPAGQRRLKVEKPGFVTLDLVIDVPRDGQVDLGKLRLEPINVVRSASRAEDDQFLAPVSITVVDKNEIDAFGFTSYIDAIRGVRGTTTVGMYDHGPATYIRGTGAEDRSQKTRLMIDGLIMESQLNSYGIPTTRDLDFERIEVQRGSGSVLYGTGAMTGLLSVYQQERVDETSATGTIGALGREGYGGLKVGVGDQKLGFWASVDLFRNRGRDVELEDVRYFDGPTGTLAPTDENGNPIPQFRDVSIEGYDPVEQLAIDGKVWFHDLEFQATFQDTVNHNNSGTRDARLLDREYPQYLHAGRASLRYRPTLSKNVKLDTRAYYQTRKTVFPREASDILFPSPFGPIYMDRVSIGSLADQWYGVEARSTIQLREPVQDNPITEADETDNRAARLIVGAEFHDFPNISILQFANINPDLPPGFELDGTRPCEADEPYDICVNEVTEPKPFRYFALSALADWRPVEWFKASAGARIDIRTTDPVQVNPRLAAMFIPTDKDVIKLMFGRGFRSADTLSRYTTVAGSVVANPDIAPEKSTTIEAEYQHRFNRDLTGLVALWSNQFSDLHIQQPTPGGLQFQNASTATSRGFDLELTRRFKGGWMANVWYSFQDTQTRYPEADGSPANADPERTLFQPRHLAATKIIAPLPAAMRVAARVVYEDGRPRTLEEGDVTDSAVIADLVLSGQAANEVLTWRAGAYNLMATQWNLPGRTDLPYRNVPQNGLQLRASLEVKLGLKKIRDTSETP